MKWFLLPFSLLYRLVVFIRNKGFDLGLIQSVSFNMPVISVGNISVGGTGKTPHTELLIGLLAKQYKVAVLSRGYKRKTKGFLEVTPKANADEVGDEPLQIKQKFSHVTVVVDEKRVHGITQLRQFNTPPQIVLLDDAFQHRYVQPGLNILLVDYNRPIYADNLLPVGRLREPAHQASRAHIIIMTKCPPTLKPIDFRIIQNRMQLLAYQQLFFTTFVYKQLIPVFEKTKKPLPLANLAACSVLAVAGIANPTLFFNELKQYSPTVDTLTYADHYQFSQSDIVTITNRYSALEGDKKMIICTEKDAVRLQSFAKVQGFEKLPLYYLPIEVEFLSQGAHEFKLQLHKFLGKYSLT